MDIKDFILIGGGLLIAAVIAHGFWIAWRERRQDLRIDIKPDLIPDEIDEIDRLRGELPNGGARLAKADPLQVALELDEPPPLELEPTAAPPPSRRRLEPELLEPQHLEPDLVKTERLDQKLRDSLDGPFEVESIDDSDYVLAEESARGSMAGEASVSRPLDAPESDPEPGAAKAAAGAKAAASAKTTASAKATVAEVALPDPIIAEQSRRPRRLAQRKTVEADASKPIEELVVMNVLADIDAPYTGDALFTVLRSCGLKFGDMNIFHRVEPLTKAVQYRVANAIEPGTFDMADMEAVRCPGLCLFMQLPGPEVPGVAFEEMLTVARSVVKSLGGEVKDEHHNVMTPQTTEHYRQRIVDFSRRRMSKRA